MLQIKILGGFGAQGATEKHALRCIGILHWSTFHYTAQNAKKKSE